MGKWIVSLGGLVVALTACLTFWSTYGWITRMAYAQDHEGAPSAQQMANIESLLISIKKDQELNQAQWECDEADEELPELELAKLNAETNRKRIEIQRDIDKTEERWDDLNCSQFTE